MKIQTKIIILFLTMITFSVFVITGVFLNLGKDAIKQRIEAQLNSIAMLKQSHLDNLVKTNSKAIESIAASDIIKNYSAGLYRASDGIIGEKDGVKQEVLQLLNEIKAYTNFYELFILDANGKIIISTNADQEEKIKSDRAYFIEGKKSTFTQNFYFSLSLQRPAVTIATPIKDGDGNTRGVLAGRVVDEIFNDTMLQRSGLGETGETFLVNKFNYVITELRFEKTKPLQKKIYTETVKKCLNGDSVFISSNNYRNVPALILYNWLPDKDLCMISQVDQAEAYKPLTMLKNNLIKISVVIIILSVILSFLFSKLITNPLKQLKNSAEMISGGDLTKRISVKSKDEIGLVSMSFNKMVENLINLKKEKFDILEKQQKELQIKVMEGTEELQAKISESEKMRKILYSLSEDIKEERDQVDKKVIEKTLELNKEHGRMLSLVESIKLGIVMLDLNYNILSANAAAKEIFNKKPEENIEFRELQEGLKTADLSHTLTYYVGEKRSINIKEVKFKDKYYRLFLSPVRDIEQKEFIGAVIIIEDITTAKLVDQMRTEIISTTSHQLRTPLSVIKGNLEMVINGDLGKVSKDQIEVLTEALAGDERMIKLVNDLTDVSKITEGNLGLNFEEQNLVSLVNENVKNLSPFAEQRKVKIIFDSTKDKFVVKIDKERMSQVIQNLIDNAIKYCPHDDRGEVKVKLVKKDHSVEIVIKDNGVGIPKPEQEKIFERFFRASNATQLDPGGGTGLGLFIAKSIIELHKGKIWFETEEGKGTTFHVELPYI